MGKKHKKHKSERKFSDSLEETGGDNTSTGNQTPAGDQSADKGEKLLKLVLKVGPQEPGEAFGAAQPSEERVKHKHKKKKKKKDGKDKEREEINVLLLKPHPQPQPSFDHKRSLPEEERTEGGSTEVPVKKICMETDTTGTGLEEKESIEDRVRHSPRSCAVRADDGVILRQCLEFLQKSLQSKDVNGFFAFPVTDSIAPGYSNIIHTPMDFSTMEAKIERNEYLTVMEYKKDFLLMCNNAMTYNRPETVYFKEAKRLETTGQKQLNVEKLLSLKKTQSFLTTLTLSEIGVDENGKILEDKPPTPQEVKPKEKPKSKSTKTVGTPFEPFPDSLSPEEIMIQATQAAKEARQELTMRKAKSNLAFLRRNKKGVTTLNILNPENEGVVSTTERVVNLAEIVGKLPSGTGTLPSFKEDKRNKVTPIQYVNYGPFSSFAPSYDSSFANTNKEESDLLLGTYGDETGVQYAKSVQSFVDSAGDYAVKMVNNLLDMLTKGQHTRTNHALEQQRRLEKEKAAAAEEAENNAHSSSMSSQGMLSPPTDAASTSTDGADLDPIQKQLNRTAEIIGDLKHAQDSRLSQTPPAHLAHCPGPSDREVELASKVTEGLANLSRVAAPGDLVSVNSVRGAMGIVSDPSSPQPYTNPSAGMPAPDSDNSADVVQADESMEPEENLPSAGTAAGSVAASQATEEDDEEDDDEEEEELGIGESSIISGDPGGMADESLVDDGASQDPSDLSEFFPNLPPQGETSMDMNS